MTAFVVRVGLFFAAAGVLFGCASFDDPGPEPHSAEFYNHNAQRLYDGGHYRQALDQFEKAVLEEPKNETALLGRAWSRLLLGEGLILGADTQGPVLVQQALDELNELQGRNLGPNNFKVALGQGKAHALLGDLYRQRAERLEAEADRSSPSEARVAALTEARNRQHAEYGTAETLFHKVITQKSNPAARDNLTALISLAWIAVYRDRFDDALLYASRYLEQVRRSKELWVDSIRNYPDDRAVWEVKLAGAVRKEIAARDLIASTLIQIGRYAEAEDELTHIIQLDPDFGDAYLRRGIVRDEQAKDELALEDFHDFMVRAMKLELEPSDPRVMEATRRTTLIRKQLGFEPDRPIDPGTGAKEE